MTDWFSQNSSFNPFDDMLESPVCSIREIWFKPCFLIQRSGKGREAWFQNIFEKQTKKAKLSHKYCTQSSTSSFKFCFLDLGWFLNEAFNPVYTMGSGFGTASEQKVTYFFLDFFSKIYPNKDKECLWYKFVIGHHLVLPLKYLLTNFKSSKHENLQTLHRVCFPNNVSKNSFGLWSQMSAKALSSKYA